MKKICAVAAVVLSALTTLCACNEKGESLSKSFFAMDTAARIVAANFDERKFETLARETEIFLTDADNSLSVARAGSGIYNFNRAAAGSTVQIDEVCYKVLTAAKEAYEFTEGYFNPAVYYSEDLYRFAARPADAGAMPYDRDTLQKLPDEKYITAFQTLSEHFSEVEVFESDGIYYAVKPDFTVEVDGEKYSLALDLGGLAKGWAVETVNKMMTDAGVEYGFFNFGFSGMSVKKYRGGDGNYTVQPRDPRGEGDYLSFRMHDGSLSTSGDNHKFYEVDGTRFCHIISPVTGAPIRTGVASVTVVGGTAWMSDALSTALAAMGKAKAADFINEKLSGYKVAMLIFEDSSGKVLTNAPDYFNILNKNYALANTVQDGKIVLK